MSTTPVLQTNRLEIIDIFRGLAIFGIFMVNVHVMNCAFPNRAMQEAQFESVIDVFTLKVLDLFFYGKFFPIFSFLFGIGISLQVQRQIEKGTFSIRFFSRRLIALFLFGVLHIVFIWSGDILHLYAILGAILLLFIKRSARFLLVSAIILLLFPLYLDIFDGIIAFFEFDFMKPLLNIPHDQLVETYRSGSYFEIMDIRLKEYKSATEILWLILAPTAITMVFLGASVEKSGVLYRIPEFIRNTKFKVLGLFSLAVITHYFAPYLLASFEEPAGRIVRYFIVYPYIISDVVIALSIVWFIAFLFQFNVGKKVLSPLRHVGQMAFTNYIMQSVLGLIIFSSLGFSYYEKGSPSVLIGIVVFIYLLQITFSKTWLKHFYFGPLEWLWRCISYFKLMPLKRK